MVLLGNIHFLKCVVDDDEGTGNAIKLARWMTEEVVCNMKCTLYKFGWCSVVCFELDIKH